MNSVVVDMTKIRQDPDDDMYFLDDLGTHPYVWAQGDAYGKSVYICTEMACEENDGCLSDVSSDFLCDTEDGEGTVHDSTFDVIRKEMEALGFDECSESTWVASAGAGPVEELIEFVKNHPRFKHRPSMA